jgi:hypothetical protein
MVRFLGITGVILDLGADMVRQVAERVRRRAAATGRTATAFCGWLGIADNWKFHDEGSSKSVRAYSAIAVPVVFVVVNQ